MHNSDQGLAADRPAAYLGNKGLFYIATDTDVVSLSDGSQWVDLGGGGGGLPSAGGQSISEGIVATLLTDNTPKELLDPTDLTVDVVVPNGSDYWVTVTYQTPSVLVTNNDVDMTLTTVSSFVLDAVSSTQALPQDYFQQELVGFTNSSSIILPSLTKTLGFQVLGGSTTTVGIHQLLDITDNTTDKTLDLTQLVPASITYSAVPVVS